MGSPGMMLRQQPLGLTLPKGVAVIGCGGVGSWTAYLLALAGVQKIWLFDDDRVSEHNLNRLPVGAEMVGKSKTQAVTELIHSLRPDCEVLPFGNFDPEMAENLGLRQEVHWIVATTDTWSSRKMVYQWSQENSVAYIEAAAEGEIGSVTGVPAEWSTPDEAKLGYASVPVWVGPCVTSAVMAVSYIIHNCWMYERAQRMGFQNGLFRFTDSRSSKI